MDNINFITNNLKDLHMNKFPMLQVALILLMVINISCDKILTSAPEAGNDFETPFDPLPDELNAMFAAGDEAFDHAFTVSEGLGPIFNNVACAACHSADGRGTPNEALVRFSRGSDIIPNEGGPQHQDKAIPGVAVEQIPGDADTSVRMPPAVFGMGLFEAIPAATIISNEDPMDADGDGISGRVNWVTAGDFVPSAFVGGGAGLQVGRFGLKANVSSLLEQVTNAYHQDMGITSDFIPLENNHQDGEGIALGDIAPDPEISAQTVLDAVVYVRLLSPPGRGEITAEVTKGETLFQGIGCASCHIPFMKTGANNVPQLDQVNANLYSDLLLHDMGPGLADNRPDGSADGFEWRTTPLWGIRLVPEFLDGSPFYLHDGRATTVKGAIELHGGEAKVASDAFKALSQADEDALMAFLESL